MSHDLDQFKMKQMFTSTWGKCNIKNSSVGWNSNEQESNEIFLVSLEKILFSTNPYLQLEAVW